MIMLEKVIQYLDNILTSSTPEKPMWNKEAILEDWTARWNYIDGCMLKAILDFYNATKNQKYIEFVDSYVDYYIKDDGSILGYNVEELNCDHINEGKVLFQLFDYTKKEKYKKALDLLYSQLQMQPRTKSGNYWHKKIYPHQIWLDGLYMVQPFLLEYDRRYRGFEGYRDVFQQFEFVYHTMRDQQTGLMYHGYDETKSMFWANPQTGLSPSFWTRSQGWYAMALVDTIETMDEQYFFEYQSLQQYLKSILDALLKVQDDKTQMFYQVSDQGHREGNYLETSGSCAIAYALMKGSRLGYVPSYYYDYGLQIYEAVSKDKLYEENGSIHLGDICLIAGLGGMPGMGDYKLRDGSYEYYISEPIVEDDAKGVAPFLFSAAQVIMGTESI